MSNSISEKLFIEELHDIKRLLIKVDKVFDSLRTINNGVLPTSEREVATELFHKILHLNVLLSSDA